MSAFAPGVATGPPSPENLEPMGCSDDARVLSEIDEEPVSDDREGRAHS